MDVGASFVSNGQSSKAVKPCECPFDDPSVDTKLLFRLDPSACDAWCDASNPAGFSAAPEVVPLVCVKLLGAPPWPPPPAALHGWHGIHQTLECHRIVPVRGPHPRHQRNAPPIHDQMMFAPSTSPIGRIRPCFRAPLFAGMLEASSEALDQSSFPDSCNSSSNTRWIRSHTPSSIHRCNRRQQVIPLPQPISRGRCSQGTPVFRMNRMPVNTARSGILGLPVPCRGSISASTGSMRSHSPDGKISLAIPLYSAFAKFVQEGFVSRSKATLRRWFTKPSR